MPETPRCMGDGTGVDRRSIAWLLIAAAVIAVSFGSVAVLRWRSPSDASSAVGRGGDVDYERGACRAFAPTARSTGRTVFLDAGHGGADPGAIAAGGSVAGKEKTFTDAITQQTLPLLLDAGYRVVLSRTGDSSVARVRPGDVRAGALEPLAIRRDIVARITCANAARADILVSVHLNSNDDPSAGGAQTLYNPNRGFSAQSRTLAVRLQRSIVASLRRAGGKIHDRGATTDRSAGGEAITPEADAYDQLLELGPAAPPWFTTPSRMPGAVIEPLFLTAPDEARLVRSAGGRAAIARGIVDGVQAYFAGRR